MVRSFLVLIISILIFLAVGVSQSMLGETKETQKLEGCDPHKHHLIDGKFSNNYCDMISSSFFTFLKWQFDRIYSLDIHSLFDEKVQLPIVHPDKNLLHNPDPNKITYTWIGHATVLLQVNGLNIITDPILSQRASPFPFFGPKRQVEVPLSLDEFPHIDIVVISHNHPDHLDTETINFLLAQSGDQPKFFVPLGVASWMHDSGATNVQELDWWEETSSNGLKVTFVPAQHWSGRGLFDHNKTLWGGWVIAHDDFSFYFAGDTGYSPDFEEIGRRFEGFDLSAIPIGAYEPRWFLNKQHVDPEQAVQLHLDIKSHKSFGVHWGTFELSDERLDQPIYDLQIALSKYGLSSDDFDVLKHGETREFIKGKKE